MARVLPRQPPIRGQRKIFPFISRIFLCSSRGKGLAAEYAGSLAARCGSLPRGLPSRSDTPNPTEDNVCKDTLKHVDIPLLPVCAYTCTPRRLCYATVGAKYSEISIAPYTPHTLVFTLCSERRCSLDAVSSTS